MQSKVWVQFLSWVRANALWAFGSARFVVLSVCKRLKNI